jgi:nitrous-oxide reductase
MRYPKLFTYHLLIAFIATTFTFCTNNKDSKSVVKGGDASQKAYVSPGEHDEYYAFLSGGYNGNITVYGLPSGRFIKEIPVFSKYPENGYGYSEESKKMFKTSYGIIPWDAPHHIEMSQEDGNFNERWLFVNGDSTPRIARIDLETFETVEVLEIPDVAGLHCSPFITENSEYLVSGTRFSVPIPQKDVSIDSYKDNFIGLINYVSLDQETGEMSMAFQVKMPGFNYDLARNGKGKSHGWTFLTTYNSEQAHTMLEKNASQKDKDLCAIINWKKAEQYVEEGKFTKKETEYFHNLKDENSGIVKAEKLTKTKILDPKKYPGIAYFLPVPKSPHGADISPNGEYIVGNGKLSSSMSVYSFDNLKKAIENKNFTDTVEGIPVIKYEAALDGIVEKPGLGPLHTEFDGKGNAYTTMFISSEVVKWDLETKEVLDKHDTYYSPGHLMIPGGETKNPDGKYLVALNKITKDRYLPTGPEMVHSAQLFDITGDKMKLILDFPTKGEPHYAQAIAADKIKPHSKKYHDLDDNTHPYAAKAEDSTKVVRDGNEVHVYMTAIRSHLAPDNIEGFKVGDEVYFHVTNLEQSWDVPHGFAMQGARSGAILVMPGETQTIKWEPKKPGVYAFYCTDFCSALHQEMSGYARVSPANSDIEFSWSLDEDKSDADKIREKARQQVEEKTKE